MADLTRRYIFCKMGAPRQIHTYAKSCVDTSTIGEFIQFDIEEKKLCHTNI